MGNEIGAVGDPAGLPGSQAVQGAVLPARLCVDAQEPVAAAVGGYQGQSGRAPCGEYTGTAPFGAIVVEPQKKAGLRGVDTLHIIDGQQRLTTLQYVLAGIRLTARELKIDTVATYLAAVLDNPNPTTMADAEVEVFKVWPTFSDQDNFRSTMTAPDRATLKARYPDHFTKAGSFRVIGIDHPPALNAIWYFAEAAEQWLKDNGASAIEDLVMAVLMDMKVVMILLEEGDDARDTSRDFERPRCRTPCHRLDPQPSLHDSRSPDRERQDLVRHQVAPVRGPHLERDRTTRTHDQATA